MITAKEAKVLYDQSGAEVDQFLKNSVEKEITDAAKAGKRTVTIYLDSYEWPGYRGFNHDITPLQMAIVVKLKELGYSAEIKSYGDCYVPRGLADDDGNGPMYQNYGIHIGW